MNNDDDWYDECNNDLELNKKLINPNNISSNSINDLLMIYEPKIELKIEPKIKKQKKYKNNDCDYDYDDKYDKLMDKYY